MLEWIRSRAPQCAALTTVVAVVLGLRAIWPGLEVAEAAPVGASPDVIVADIHDAMSYGSLNNMSAFAIGTTSCNIGNAPLDWVPDPSPNHPVIAQNLYRVKDGRIEQIGLSWLKHGFLALNQSVCGACTTPAGHQLGVNCSDPYSAGLNGSQASLGPRSQVNAATGAITIPHRRLKSPPNLLDGRLQVSNGDLNPTMNKGAKYFAEAQYVHPQDAKAGKGNNNASYRQVTFPQQMGQFKLTLGAATVRQLPAIYAWRAESPDVRLFNIDVPHDGRLILGVRSVRMPKGGLHHEIALHNLNSDRSAQALTVRTQKGAVRGPGFHGVKYVQEAYSGADWKATTAGPAISWATQTFTADPNANAVRWGTLYSFWFDSDTPATQAIIRLFKPGPKGDPIEMTVSLAGLHLASPAAKTWVVSEALADRDVGAKKTFRLVSPEGVDRELKEVTSSHAGVRATAKKGAKKDKEGRTYWNVTIEPTKDAKGGYFETILTFKTKTAADLPVSIRAYGVLPKKPNAKDKGRRRPPG